MQSVILAPPFSAPESGLDMALNDQDRAWIREAIRESGQRTRLGKLLTGIKEWGGTGAAVAILIAFFSQWSSYVQFKTHTNDELGIIDGRLKTVEVHVDELRAIQSPERVLHELNGLDQQHFAQSLPVLRMAIEQPIAEAKPTQPLLNGIAEKLKNTRSDSPDYWPTVLQFLQFASSGLAPANVPSPGMRPVFNSTSNLFLEQNVFQGATIRLNGGVLKGDRFENCRIVFTETPVQMENVTFINSVFEFPVSTNPPLYIRKASQTLLASDLKTVSIAGL